MVLAEFTVTEPERPPPASSSGESANVGGRNLVTTDGTNSAIAQRELVQFRKFHVPEVVEAVSDPNRVRAAERLTTGVGFHPRWLRKASALLIAPRPTQRSSGWQKNRVRPRIGTSGNCRWSAYSRG